MKEALSRPVHSLGRASFARVVLFCLLLSVPVLANPPANTCGSLDADFTLTASPGASAGTCFTVVADGITLDCGGYAITYRSSVANTYGIDLNSKSNVTIKNCRILTGGAATSGNSHGIYVRNSNNNTIYNVNATIRDGQALNFSNSSYNNVTFSQFFSIYEDGVEGWGLSYSNFTRVNITGGNGGGDYGLYLHDSSYGNRFVDGSINSSIGGDITAYLLNYADGNLFYDLNVTAASTNYAFYLTTSSNNNISLSTVTTITAGGFRFQSYSNDNDVQYVNITTLGNGGVGAYFEDNSNSNAFDSVNVNAYSQAYYLNLYSWYNNATNCNFTSRTSYGVLLNSNNNYNILANNTIRGGTSASSHAVYFTGGASYNILDDNNITARNGIGVYGYTYTSYNNITNNAINATGNSAIYLSTSATYNYIYNNNMTTNSIGVVFAASSDSNTVYSNSINSTANYGVQVGSCSYSNFTNNSIYSYNTGVYLPSASYNIFDSNTIKSYFYYGVTLSSDSSYNNFSSNNISAGRTINYYGVYIATSSYNRFWDNLIMSNDTAGSAAVYLTTSANSNNFTRNTINGTATNAYGVYITSTCSYNTFESNNISSWVVNQYAVRMDSNSNYNNFSNNNISANYYVGIGVTGTSRANRFYNNTVYGGGTGNAVYIDTSNENYFYNTTAYSNISVAAYLNHYAQSNVFDRGTISSNASYGFYLYDNSNGNSISNMAFLSNKSYGIALSTAAQNNVFYNVTSTTNLSYAVYLTTNCNNNTFMNSTFVANASAVYFSGSSYNQFFGVNITAGTNANNYGVYMQTNSRYNWFNSSRITATGTNGYDIYSTGSSYNSFLNTTFDKMNLYFADAFSTVNISWFYSVVTKALNAALLEGSSVSVNDTFGNTVVSNAPTNATGVAGMFPLVEYVQMQTGSTNYYPYYAYAYLTGATGASDPVSLTTNSQSTIYLDSSTCGTLYADTTLRNDVYAEGTCFTVGVSGISIDCAGYAVNYSRTSTGYALSSTNKENAILRNCRLNQRSANNASHAVYLSGGQNISVENSTITTIDSSAFYLTNSSRNDSVVSSTYNYSRAYFNGTGSSLMRLWQFLVTVRDFGNDTFEGASVFVYDNNATLWASGTTNATGQTPVFRLRETLQTSNNATTYYNNYTVNTSSGQLANSSAFNVTADNYAALMRMNVTACRTLTSSYILTNDVNAQGTCFTFGADNLTLDCAGYAINYSKSSAGYGVFLSGVNAGTVRNCRITREGLPAEGIYSAYLLSSNNSLVANTTFSSAGALDLMLENSHNSTALSVYPSDSLFVQMDSQSSNLTRSWYAYVHVVGLADEDVASAPISVINYQNQTEASGTANSTGYFSTILREYSMDNASATYYSPLNFTAVHPGTQQMNYTVFNLTQNGTVTVHTLSASINVSSPVENQVYFQGLDVTITINETKGQSWINNVTFTIDADEDESNILRQAVEIAPDLWQYNYSIDPSMTPKTVLITAYGMNGAVNVSATRQFVITRTPGGGISAPVAISLCGNQTYSVQNSTVSVNFTADLDTVLYRMSANVTYPDNTTADLTQTSVTGNESTYIYSGFFDLPLTQAGEYTVRAEARDVNDQRVYSFVKVYAVSGEENSTVGLSGVSGLEARDSCSNIMLANSSAGAFTLPPGKYTLHAYTSGPELFIVNASLNSSTVASVSFAAPATVTYPLPLHRRFVKIFNVSLGNLGYDEFQLHYNYSAQQSTLVAESSLEFRKCEEMANGSCPWENVSYSLSTATTLITASSPSASIWGLFEPAFNEPPHADPVVVGVCGNQTYSLVGSTVSVNFTAQLYSNLYRMTANVTYPDNTTADLVQIGSQEDNSTHLYSAQFALPLTQAGEYRVVTEARDTGDQFVLGTTTIYARAAAELSTVRLSGATALAAFDSCSGTLLANSSAASFSLPSGNYTLRAYTDGPLLTFVNASLNSSVSNASLFFDAPASVPYAVPSSRRFVRIFNVSLSGIAYGQFQLYYNYSQDAPALVAEASLELRKCDLNENGSCPWENVSYSLRTDSDEISTSSPNASIWVLLEPSHTNVVTSIQQQEVSVPVAVPVNVNVTVPVPYRVNVTVEKEVQKLVSSHLFKAPAPIETHPGESVDTMIELYNSGETDFSAVAVLAEASDPRISVSVTPSAISSMPAGSTSPVMVSVDAGSAPAGNYSITLKAESGDYSDSVRVPLVIAKFVSSQKFEVAKQLEFARSLDKANPECLEFEYNLDLAQRALDAGDVEWASKLVSESTEGCKNSLTLMGEEKLKTTGLFLARQPKQDAVTTYAVVAAVGAAAAFALVMLGRLVRPRQGNRTNGILNGEDGA